MNTSGRSWPYFDLFFEEPIYLTQTRSGSLVRYPERALSITYSPFLLGHSQPSQKADSDHRVSRSAREAWGRQTIEDLTRRITELGQANQTLAEPSLDESTPAATAEPPKPAIDRSSELDGETQQRLLDLIKKLEPRISTLERQRQAPSPRGTRTLSAFLSLGAS